MHLFQIYFMVCQNFNKNVTELRKYLYNLSIYQFNDFLGWYQNLYTKCLNFQKFEKFKNENFSRNHMLLSFSSVWIFLILKTIDCKIRNAPWF